METLPQQPVPNPQVAGLCRGSGRRPLYSSVDGENFSLDEPGDPWMHPDGCLRLGNEDH